MRIERTINKDRDVVDFPKSPLSLVVTGLYSL